MRRLYLITGPAGVGKTTISNKIAVKMKRSALIEGDDIYHFVKGGYVHPWLEGNHLDVFWLNSINLIKNFLNNGYDVVFNYIISNEKFKILKEEFKDIEIRFIVLMVDEETILERDKKRPKDTQMGERSLTLLNDFKKDNYHKKYLLDTSKLSIDETVDEIIRNNRFLVVK